MFGVRGGDFGIDGWVYRESEMDDALSGLLGRNADSSMSNDGDVCVESSGLYCSVYEYILN